MNIPSSSLIHIITYISRSPDREICGLLCGPVDGEPTITNVISLTNHSKKDSRFEIRLNELASCSQSILQQGLKVHAIYHSHPSGNLTPSFSDIMFARTTQIPLVIFAMKNKSLSWTELSP